MTLSFYWQIRQPALAHISHKIRRERPEIECWCGFRADERVKLGPTPCKVANPTESAPVPGFWSAVEDL